jgi:hypothetical protein
VATLTGLSVYHTNDGAQAREDAIERAEQLGPMFVELASLSAPQNCYRAQGTESRHPYPWSPKYIERHLGEFANHRELLNAMFDLLVAAA